MNSIYYFEVWLKPQSAGASEGCAIPAASSKVCILGSSTVHSSEVYSFQFVKFMVHGLWFVAHDL